MIKIEDADNGLDMFFKTADFARNFVSFVKSTLPCSVKNSKQLISTNERNNTANVKNSFSVIIPKICKDDLVRIPRKLAQ